MQEDTSTLETLHAIDRWKSLYDVPEDATLLCDNAACFQTLARAGQLIEEREATKEQPRQVLDLLTRLRFITPRSPWMGGWWERRVGLIKAALYAATVDKVPTLTELTTLIRRACRQVNLRPLLVGKDGDVDSLVLTPLDFIFPMRHLSTLPIQIPKFEDDPFPGYSTAGRALNSRAFAQELLRQFWDHWFPAHLDALRDAHIRQERMRTSDQAPLVRPGAYVLVRPDKGHRCTRGDWPVARVLAVQPSQDGAVRQVTLRRVNYAAARKDIERPASALVPLELQLRDIHDIIDPSDKSHFDQLIARDHFARTYAQAAAGLNAPAEKIPPGVLKDDDEVLHRLRNRVIQGRLPFDEIPPTPTHTTPTDTPQGSPEL